MSGASQPRSRAEEGRRLGDVGRQRPAALALEQREVLRREGPEERRLVGLVVELRHAVVLQVVADRQVLAHLDPVGLRGRRPARCPRSSAARATGTRRPRGSPRAPRGSPRRLPPRAISTPTARAPSNRIRSAIASVITSRFGRDSAGCRNAAAVEQRRPSRCVSWKRPTPVLAAPLKSGLCSWPASTLASIIVSISGLIDAAVGHARAARRRRGTRPRRARCPPSA